MISHRHPDGAPRRGQACPGTGEAEPGHQAERPASTRAGTALPCGPGLWSHVFRPCSAESLAHSSIRPLAHSLNRSLTHSLVHSFIHSSIHSLVRSFAHSLPPSFIHSLVHYLSHSLIHSPSHSLTHLHTQSPTHTLTHSPTHTPAPTLSHTFTHTLTCLLTFTHSLTYTHTPSHTHTHSHTHPHAHPLTHSHLLIYLLTHSHAWSHTHSHITHTYTLSHTHPHIHSPTCTLTHVHTHTPVHLTHSHTPNHNSLIHLLTHSLTHSSTHTPSHTHILSHSHTYPVTHPLVHLLTHARTHSAPAASTCPGLAGGAGFCAQSSASVPGRVVTQTAGPTSGRARVLWAAGALSARPGVSESQRQTREDVPRGEVHLNESLQSQKTEAFPPAIDQGSIILRPIASSGLSGDRGPGRGAGAWGSVKRGRPGCPKPPPPDSRGAPWMRAHTSWRCSRPPGRPWPPAPLLSPLHLSLPPKSYSQAGLRLCPAPQTLPNAAHVRQERAAVSAGSRAAPARQSGPSRGLGPRSCRVPATLPS